MICHICGEEKDPTQFFRVKHFYKYMNTKRIWCRVCQKLFMQMKKEELVKKQFDQKVENQTFNVSFF